MSKQKKEKLKNNKVSTQKTSSPPILGTNKKPALWLAGILLLTFIAFSPSLKNGFTNWDDNVYIGENTLIKNLSGENIKKMFDTDNHVSLNYHPITILSLALDYKLSGYNPKTYHFTNLIFHLLNTALVFWFVFLLSERKIIVAGFVALFFGIHPMHVESVAWISERKDVLYTFFFMAALIAYYRYVFELGKNKILSYVLILFLYLLAILSKAMAVVLPLIFILLDYYTGRKFDKKLVLEKIPFFALSLVFGLLASHIQAEGAAIAEFETFTWLQRFAFAAYGLTNYLARFFVPLHLSCFYPYPHLINDHLPIIYYICPLIVAALFSLVFYNLKKNKVFVFGFLFYFITVVLVLQFISVGQVIAADRYTYLAYVGLLFPIGMGYNWLENQTDKKYAIYKIPSALIIIFCIVFFSWLTFDRTKVWKNSDVLWTDAINKYPQSESSYRNRGSYLINKEAYDLGQKKIGEREIDRALNDFNISIQLNPNSAKVFTNRANIHGLKGRFDLALLDYSKAIELDKKDEQTFFNRAITYSIMKQFDKAIEDFTTAISLDPDFTIAKQSRAFAYVDAGDYKNAIAELGELIKKDSRNFSNYFYRGIAYFNSGNAEAAIIDNTRVIELEPSNKGAYFNRSIAYKSVGNYSGALQDALKAQSLGYNVDQGYLNNLRSQIK